MSRRILAPLLLLLAAVGSVAAVFVVHGIEAAGGPLAEPFVSHWVSPGRDRDDGGVAVVRFTTQQPERITVRIVDEAGRVRSTVIEDETVDGMHVERWYGTDDDGDALPDGSYRVEITRAGDSRVYAPNNFVAVDTKPPVAQFDTGSYVGGELRALVLMPETADIAVTDRDGQRVDEELRASRPAAGTPTVTPRAQWPPGTVLLRLKVPVRDRSALAGLQVSIVDAAGNRTDLLDDDARRGIRIVA